MIAEYQFYHGALLHELITSAGAEIRVGLRDFHGRPDAYVIEGRIGLLLKHSTSRLTPWLFTFTKEHLNELSALSASTDTCFVVFVCGEDGFVCVRKEDLNGIVPTSASDVASVRVDRRPRKMYRVSSSGQPLDRKVAKGVHEIVSEIVNAPKVRKVSRRTVSGAITESDSSESGAPPREIAL